MKFKELHLTTSTMLVHDAATTTSIMVDQVKKIMLKSI